MSDTVAVVFVRRAIDVVSDRPDLYQSILVGAGLSDDRLQSPEARVPAECFDSVWKAVSTAIDDEYFHIDSRRMKCGSFAFLCRGLVHERTVGDALRRCLKGFGLFFDDVSARLDVNDQQASIYVDVSRVASPKRVWGIELLFTMTYGITCWLAGRRVPLTHVEFAFPRPDYALEYRHWLSDSVTFDAERSQMHFDASWLSAPVIASASSLAPFLGSWPYSVFIKYRDLRGWTYRVRQILKSVPYADWPEVGALASRMHMSPATLQRRLGAEGTSYSAVKAEVRRDLAVRLLRDGDMPIQDVAAQAGYQEVSAFYRAFRQWTGRAPGDYREGQRAL